MVTKHEVWLGETSRGDNMADEVKASLYSVFEAVNIYFCNNKLYIECVCIVQTYYALEVVARQVVLSPLSIEFRYDLKVMNPRRKTSREGDIRYTVELYNEVRAATHLMSCAYQDFSPSPRSRTSELSSTLLSSSTF